MNTSLQTSSKKHPSLNTVLLIPFVILIILAVSLIGYISYRNGQQAVNEVALQLRNEVNAGIHGHLESFVQTPHEINAFNAMLMSRGVLPTKDQEQLTEHFWEQVQLFETVTSIYFGNTEGGLANAGREGAGGFLYQILTEDFTRGTLHKYATDSQGNPVELLSAVPDFDSQKRAWFIQGVEKGDSAWSEAYILITGQDMAISASKPVYDAQGILLGVTAVDLFLSHLGEYLSTLPIGKTGESFIMERSGLLIASSTRESPFLSDASEQYRILAVDSSDPMIQGTARAMDQQFNGYEEIRTDQQFEFSLEEEKIFGQVKPFQDQYGLDWLIVTAMPEMDFMAQIHANNRTTLLLMAATFIVTVLVGIMITRRILKPMAHLNALAQGLTQGNWDQPIHMQSKIREIHTLSESFKHMARQLKEMVFRLNHEKELFKATLLSVGDGIISTDHKGRVVLLNDVAQELTQWTQIEAAEQPLPQVFNIIDENSGMCKKDPARRVLATGEIVELGNHTLLLNREGEKIPVEDTAAPIKDKDGNITGVVIVFRDCTEKKKKQEEIQYLSFHDTLTGLYNRSFLEEEIKRLDTEEQYPISIIMADVNGLKMINDSYGYDAGNEFLQKAAEILRKACGEEDIVVRWGGDEFVIFLPQTTLDEAWIISEGISQVSREFQYRSLPISMALGVSSKVSREENIYEIIGMAEKRMHRNKLAESRSVRSAVLASLRKTLAEKSLETEEHTDRMGCLAEKIADKLGLTRDEKDRLNLLVSLHDIGKITISREILNKPGKLTKEEWEEIKGHTETGYRIARSTKEIEHVALDILSHHERWDGNGYPQGLSEENIPLLARINAIVDAYDVMTNGRPYKEPMTKEEAIEELKRCAGTQFDPELVNYFIDILE